MAAAAGMVRIQAHTIRPATPHLTALIRRNDENKLKTADGSSPAACQYTRAGSQVARIGKTNSITARMMRA